MSILTRYILKAHVGPFLFALGILTGLLLVNTVARRFEELAGKGLEFRVILEVFFLSLPHIIALTLPMAVLVAVLYTFSQLAADNEINALKSSGVNLVRLLMPLLAASVVLAVFMIWFNDRVLPETNHRLKNLLVDIGRQTPMMELQEQVVNEITTTSNMDGRYYLYATKIDAATNRLWDVIIYDMSTPGRTRTVYADSGRMSFTPDRTDLYMILYSGHIHELETTRFETLHRLYFDEQRLRIAGVGTQFERTVEEGFRSDREMSAAMLAAEVRDARGQVEQVRKETADHLEAALRRSLSWRGTTLPVGGSASNVLDRAEAAVLEMESGRADSGMLRSADVMARQLTAELRALQSREEMHQIRANQYRVEYHKKFAIPLACVVFVLIGAPLAVRFPRGGAGMVIAISLTIFALYYAVLIGGEELGDRGTVSPAGAMWAPNAVLLVFGLWGLARIGKETATTRGGGWDDLAYTLRRTLTRPFRALRRRAA